MPFCLQIIKRRCSHFPGIRQSRGHSTQCKDCRSCGCDLHPKSKPRTGPHGVSRGENRGRRTPSVPSSLGTTAKNRHQDFAFPHIEAGIPQMASPGCRRWRNRKRQAASAAPTQIQGTTGISRCEGVLDPLSPANGRVRSRTSQETAPRPGKAKWRRAAVAIRPCGGKSEGPEAAPASRR